MSLITLGLCFFVIVSEVRSGVIIDGLKKAIDNTKCHLHGLTNAIHHHEHDSNPCKVKNQAGNSQHGISGNTNSKHKLILFIQIGPKLYSTYLKKQGYLFIQTWFQKIKVSLDIIYSYFNFNPRTSEY